jgi:hypothetical protein
MEDVVRQQEQLCVAAWGAAAGPGSCLVGGYARSGGHAGGRGRAAGGKGAPMTMAAAAALLPHQGVAPHQLVEALEDTWGMCREELCAKVACMSVLLPTMTAEEFADLQPLLHGKLPACLRNSLDGRCCKGVCIGSAAVRV